MVKGCQRNMIVLRDVGSEIYEEAYFLLREDLASPPPGQAQLIEEANRIVTRNLITASQKRARKKHSGKEALLWFLSGLLTGIGVAFLLML